MREAPLSPPSVLASNNSPQMGILEGIMLLVKNKNYVLLFITFNLMFGNYNAIGAILSTITEQYSYTVGENGMLALMFLVAGITSSFILGFIVDKYQCYKKVVIGLCFFTIIFMALTFGSLSLSAHIVFCFNMLLIGAAVVPITSICYAFQAELAYPVPETLANG